jgi:mono/diheme cytochrome c family protein
VSSSAAHRIGLVLVAAGALAGIALLIMGGGGAGAEPAPLRTFATEEERLLHERLSVLFGSPEQPRAPAGFEAAGLPAAGPDGDAHLSFGRRVWRTQCLHCHGHDGGADTSTAALLNPRPRDFGRGIVKFTSTRAGAPATRADLERTVRQGLPYTAMSGFDALPESSLQTVVDYSHWLLLRAAVLDQAYQALATGADPVTALDQAAQSVLAANTAQAPVEVPPQPPLDAAASARGAALYADAAIGCAGCHGANGTGRGPLVWDPAAETWLLRDAWGLPAQPRDLSDGQFHGGDAPADLFRRVHAGVKGTPMPAFGERLNAQQIWDLVAYLQALAK